VLSQLNICFHIRHCTLEHLQNYKRKFMCEVVRCFLLIQRQTGFHATNGSCQDVVPFDPSQRRCFSRLRSARRWRSTLHRRQRECVSTAGLHTARLRQASASELQWYGATVFYDSLATPRVTAFYRSTSGDVLTPSAVRIRAGGHADRRGCKLLTEPAPKLDPSTALDPAAWREQPA
jgi:hypothetical protein